MNNISFKQISSLEKIFIETPPDAKEISDASVLKGEEYSYQIAFSDITDKAFASKTDLYIKINSKLSEYITIRRVMNIPSELSIYSHDYDDGYYPYKSGLFPDALIPLENDRIYVVPNKWYSVWISVNVPQDIEPGKYDIDIIFENDDFSEVKTLKLEIIDLILKKQELKFTQWFHSDCIASIHNVKIFSNEHWNLIEKYIKIAASNGINMLLTPIFTPPLDTQIGGERPTVQLVDCKFENGKYSFNFDKLTKWIDICKKSGIEYFEISHLFTQWGAKCAPKIEVMENGNLIKKFGWHTEATGEEYSIFLNSFLPELIKYLDEKGIASSTYFHISDEPNDEHMDSYKKARNSVLSHIKNFKIIDALSDFEFYKQGLVEIPVPSSNHINHFLECDDIPERWAYYCCAQTSKVSNRFFAMPSTRNRIIGAQFSKFNIEGFLHWGYNFYYSQFSKDVINPYNTTDAWGAFPSGDAFSVYPYKDGVAESIRLKVFKDALQDLRAMKMLEEFKGKDFVLKIIEEECGMELKFDQFPFWGDYILSYRERINHELKKIL